MAASVGDGPWQGAAAGRTRTAGKAVLFRLRDQGASGTRRGPGARVPGEDGAVRERVRERVRALAGLAEEIGARPCARAVRLVAVDGRGGVRVDDFLCWRDIAGRWPRLDREALRPAAVRIAGPVRCP